ncbi:lysozyme inhibitor LprI family protein [Pseudomonas sp. RA_35y_Pfl2_P32]|uniref:lysozyme inhibitor LprI family protein n=1 Tax=Pseudomonas sp. RA_35y_Pfl2_P32 TaxID=3088705 RepID=UPI0030DDAC24
MRSVFLLSVLSLLATTGAQADDCASASNQATLNECAAKQYQQADAQFNTLYQQINGQLKDNPQGKKRLLTAQRAWLAFRDAECTFAASGVEGGSVYPMIHNQCLADQTQKRVETFKSYLDCQEGDLSCPVRA